MPTDQNAYNSRVTDEALEKRFRDTFRSQGGAELVDDLYASGVIVPVVDFTAAATGQQLNQNLQTAWDFSTGHQTISTNTTATLISNAGFWQIEGLIGNNSEATTLNSQLFIDAGVTTKIIWEQNIPNGAGQTSLGTVIPVRVVFLRSGDSLKYTNTSGADCQVDWWYRQIADLSGNLVNPFGFTSS
jgi:hypothetical protein